MMWALICYAFVLTSEGITAWSYFEQVFERKGSRKVEIWMFILGYTLLFVLSQFKNVLVNTVAFLFVNLILLFSNFACKKLIGIIQVAFLTVVMGGTEILAAVLLLPISHDFGAYKYDLSVMISFAVLGRLLYFSIMQISARLFKPTKDGIDTSTVLLLSVLPLVSVLITMTITYISITTRIRPIVGILMAISVIALLMVNILVTVVYNHIQKMYNDRLELELIAQKAKMDTENYKILENQYENQRVLIHDIRGHMQVMRGLLESKNYDELENYPITIDDQTNAVEEIRVQCRHQRYDVIVVDYLQLVRCKRKFNNRASEVGEVSKQFKALARELHVPIILLSQLHRISEMNATKEPTMSELRESGDIEQDASNIILMWNLDEDRKFKGLKVEKNRQGTPFREVVQFEGDRMEFIERAETIEQIQARMRQKDVFRESCGTPFD